MNWYKIASGSGMPSMTFRDIRKFLLGQGFTLERQKRHAIFKTPAGKVISIPNHNDGAEVSPRIVKGMLQEMGWTNNDFKKFHASKGRKVPPNLDYTQMDKMRTRSGYQ